MRSQLTILFAIAATASAAAADRAPNNDELWAGGTSRSLRSPSANALTAANLAGGSAGYARDLGVTIGGAVALWAEAVVTTGSATGTMFQTLSTRLTAVDLVAGLRARYPLHRLVVASARLDLGVQRVQLAITGDGDDASDHSWGQLGAAGVALDVFARSRPPLGIGARVELGYVMARPLSLTARRDIPDDVLVLAMTEAGLGDLDLSGPTVSVSVAGQF